MERGGILSELILEKKILKLNIITEKPFTSKRKREMKGWLNTSLKSTGTRDELSITLYLQSEINFCSDRMPVNA